VRLQVHCCTVPVLVPYAYFSDMWTNFSRDFRYRYLPGVVFYLLQENASRFTCVIIKLISGFEDFDSVGPDNPSQRIAR